VTDMPRMTSFRTSTTDDGILHLVFDMPDRSMNVFTSRAINEIEAFAAWLKGSDVAGVVISSGKANAFCAGADLTELAQAYEMIMAAPKEERDLLTVEHFSPIGRAFRMLETAGKPVAVAVHGLALGGGCELFLACHYRVLTDAKETQIGLPESLVGLLPGGGGTQRLPRFTGVEESLGVLIEGARFDAGQAVALGAASEAVPPGEEVKAAEAWIRSKPDPRQPWDRPDWKAPTRDEVLAATRPVREEFLRRTGGHYPAELAILDCLDEGLPRDMDGGIEAEMDSFKDLVQRIEPRNMIAVKFLGRVDHDRRKRKNTLPDGLDAFAAQVKAAMDAKMAALGPAGEAARAFAGIDDATAESLETARDVAGRRTQWFEKPLGDVETAAFAILAGAALVAAANQERFKAEDRNLVDLHCQQAAGFPAYLGGPFTFLARYGAERCRSAAG
jgi:3-hydroxyacyl-CoA dehydrogenase / enoyl-CoA hydratase / 3-hydroxybutyryl-CoA epimerase